MQSFAVNGTVKVPDEDPAYKHGAMQGGGTLGPHDTTWSTVDRGMIQDFQGPFCISSLLEVDKGIPKRAQGDLVPAHTDRQHGTHLTEFL